MRSQTSLLPGAVAVMVAVAAAAVPARSTHAQPVAFGDLASSVEPAATAVAVVPFANVSARPEDDWLGIGIAETVVSGVERLGYRFATARSTRRRDSSSTGNRSPTSGPTSSTE